MGKYLPAYSWGGNTFPKLALPLAVVPAGQHRPKDLASESSAWR